MKGRALALKPWVINFFFLKLISNGRLQNCECLFLPPLSFLFPLHGRRYFKSKFKIKKCGLNTSGIFTFTAWLEWEKSKFFLEIRDSPVFSSLQIWENTGSSSNSEAQKFRNLLCLPPWQISYLGMMSFFFLSNLSTDAMLLQCRHWQLQKVKAFIRPQNR